MIELRTEPTDFFGHWMATRTAPVFDSWINHPGDPPAVVDSGARNVPAIPRKGGEYELGLSGVMGRAPKTLGVVRGE